MHTSAKFLFQCFTRVSQYPHGRKDKVLMMVMMMMMMMMMMVVVVVGGVGGVGGDDNDDDDVTVMLLLLLLLLLMTTVMVTMIVATFFFFLLFFFLFFFFFRLLLLHRRRRRRRHSHAPPPPRFRAFLFFVFFNENLSQLRRPKQQPSPAQRRQQSNNKYSQIRVDAGDIIHGLVKKDAGKAASWQLSASSSSRPHRRRGHHRLVSHTAARELRQYISLKRGNVEIVWLFKLVPEHLDHTIIWNGQHFPTGNSSRRETKRQTEETMGRQHQRVDWPSMDHHTTESREPRGVEEAGCKIYSGAPTASQITE